MGIYSKDADPDLKYREFIKKYGYPKTKEQAKALIEKAKKEGIDPDYIKGMERGLNTWDATPFELRMIENNERMLATAKRDLEEAKRNYAKHPGEDFWKELLIDAQNDVKRAEENLERSKRQATKDASPWEYEYKVVVTYGKGLADPEKFVYADSDEEAKKTALKYTESWKLKQNPVAKIVSKKKLTNDASPEEVAKKIEIEKLVAFLKKHPVGSDNPMISRDLRKARERLSELLDKKKTSDNDATENGAIEEFGQNHETEVMPLEKDPVLAQDDKFGTVMKEFYEGKLKSGSGETVTDPQQAKAIAYSESKDSEPVYTLEDLEQRLKDLEKEDYIDTFVLGDKPDPKLRKKIEDLKKQIKEKKMTKDEKTYQNGEHVKVVNHETGDKIELKVLRDNKDGTLEVKAPTGAVLTIKKAWIVDAAYDPKKYEGTKRHETNIWYIENEVTKWRNRYENAKDRVNSFNRMVSSGVYGKMTNQELKEANRDLEAARMRLEQALSMLKRARGQKDEAPTVLDECMKILKLSGFTNDTKPLVGEVVNVDSPREGQFLGRVVSVSSRWADIKILHGKNLIDPGRREGDIVSVDFQYIKV